ncbi:3-oxoacyl-[acyl-carrier-protein] reductase [Gordonia hirsuta DSM 44140 = NBRC 16056]|uniref:3-oxoacyl-[acyl-carrier-protein] reductase n=1 Tax=Gordonia hirsuta DSM 44140 = NBRC 16056 TaxID=1121927 RepID=L7LDD2_9ACTN|nr:3-oxoacyl-[acyl-carrier-protein] reductase [Gordonia hirsuta DSM 44140 = NBRC 16056]
MSERTLADKNVLIAGDGKDLGGLIARQAAAAGAHVAIHFNSEASRADAEQTLAAIEAGGRSGVLIQADLTVPENTARLFAEAEAGIGKIDVAVNTVGKILRKPILDTTEAEHDEMLDVNAKSAYFFINAAGQNLADSGKVTTIVTALLGGFTDGYSTYAGGESRSSNSPGPRRRNSPIAAFPSLPWRLAP